MTLTAGKSYFANENDLLMPLMERVLSSDIIQLDASELPIAKLREAISQLQQRPFGELRVLWINHASSLNESLQNTLLKVLEEPPSFAVVVLQGQSLESFLPTVRSRLHRLTLTSQEQPNGEEIDINTLIGAKDRQEVIRKLETYRQFLKSQLMNGDIESAERLDLIESVYRKLSQNCNLKLTFDWLLLHWPQQ